MCSPTVASSKGAFDCDCVETFIDAGDTGNYAHLAVNVAGDIYKAGFCGDAKATVQLHEKDWTVEIEIPYSSLKLSGQVFSKNWKINFCRGNYGIKEISSWAKLGTGSFHDTAAFNAQKESGYKTLYQYLWHECAAEYDQTNP